MLSCEDCDTRFGREDNLRRHKNHHCNGGEKSETCKPNRERMSKTYGSVGLDNEIQNSDDEIPTFDGDEYCGNKPLTRQTCIE